jgi:hypothetical protein
MLASKTLEGVKSVAGKKKSSGSTSRSSKSGRFVTKKYADSHKSTTQTSRKKKK